MHGTLTRYHTIKNTLKQWTSESLIILSNENKMWINVGNCLESSSFLGLLSHSVRHCVLYGELLNIKIFSKGCNCASSMIAPNASLLSLFPSDACKGLRHASSGCTDIDFWITGRRAKEEKRNNDEMKSEKPSV